MKEGGKLRTELKELMRKVASTDPEHEGGYTYEFNNKDCIARFRSEILPKTKVVYRATSDDKHMFVAALEAAGVNCAVTGEAPNDAEALREASVGFAMGVGGCAVARDNSDIIILNDAFGGVVSAIRWGRNIFENCRKFVQFQLTVNISCLFIVIVGGASLGSSPFSVIQLLWINLVMDVLAAVALATEAPHPSKLRRDRVRLTGPEAEKILTPRMWRAVSFQVTYQAIVMLVLLYAGPNLFGIGYNLFSTALYERRGPDKVPTWHLQHNTLMFQAFALMNLFNMLNCRVVETENEPGYWVFGGLFRSWWFLIVWLAELNIQCLVVGCPGPGAVFQATPLTPAMHLTCLALGLGSLVVAAIAKSTPDGLLKVYPALQESEGEASYGAGVDKFVNAT